jgi:hypothetical protein
MNKSLRKLIAAVVLGITAPTPLWAAGFFEQGQAPVGGYPSSPTFVHVGTVDLTATDNVDAVRGKFSSVLQRGGFDVWTINDNSAIASGVGPLLDNSTLAGKVDFSHGETFLPRPMVDVRNYMDGLSGRPTLAAWLANQTTTDVSKVFQAARTAVTDGGKIYIPPGTFLITLASEESAGDLGGVPRFAAVVFGNSNVTVEGSGPESIIYIPTWATNIGGTDNVPAFFLAGSTADNLTNIHFRNFKILGDFPQTDNTWSGNEVSAAISIGAVSQTATVSNSGVDHVWFEKIGMGVMFNGGNVPGPACDRNYVTNSIFYNTSGGPLNAISGAHTNTLITNNIFRNIGGNYAIEWGSYRVSIIGNIFDNVWGGGITTETNPAATGYSLIGNNIFNDIGLRYGPTGTYNTAAIQLSEGTSGHQMAIKDNIFRNIYGSGIWGASHADNVIVDGNVIDGFGLLGTTRTPGIGTLYAGINFTNLHQIRVTNNHVICNGAVTDNCEYGFIVGGSLAEDNYTRGNTTLGTFASASFQLPTSVGRNGAGTRIYHENNIDLTTGKLAIPQEGDNEKLFPTTLDNDATPDVTGSNVWFVNNSAATSITMLDGGYPGQIVTLFISNGNTTLVNSASFILAGAANFVGTANDVITLLKYSDNSGGVWVEVSRSVN